MCPEHSVSYVSSITIAALTRQGATNIRVEAADTQYDVAIHKKSFGDITKAIECIQAAL
jgi:hypothetical protein